MEHILKHFAWSDCSSKESVKIVYSDNTKKLLVKQEKLSKLGIEFRITSAHSPESD